MVYCSACASHLPLAVHRVDHLKGHAVLNGSSELDFAEDKRCLKTENRLSGPGFQRQVGRDRQFPDKNATH